MTTRILRKKTGSSTAAEPQRPEKPYPEYPLSVHASGKWCKKVRGRIYYFGAWDDPIRALNEWLAAKDHLIAGVDPKQKSDQFDIEWLVNAFLDSKEQQRQEGDLARVTFDDYFKTCQRIAKFFGKGRALATIDAPDFKRFRSTFSKTWGPTTVNSEIASVGVVFNFAYDYGGVEKPVRFGPNFKRVSKKKQRLHKASQPPKEFTASEIHQLLAVAGVQLKAMIMLGINAGYGNADCGRLEVPMIDFDRQWIEGLRKKTAIQRAAWLWPETMDAVHEAIDARYQNAPEPLKNRLFVTKRRQAWYREDGSADPISAAFSKLRFAAFEEGEVAGLVEAGSEKADALKSVKLRRRGVGFYSLRHMFETVGGNAKDQIAVNYVMGHADDSMAAVYREGIDPQRIIDVCEHVRQWWLAGATSKEG